MASLYRKPVAETMKKDGESGYQSDGKWNKYAERLDACDFFAGCGKKNGAVDFCGIAYCYWLFVNVTTDDGNTTDDDRKYMTHYAMYQSDDCCTSAGCTQQAEAYKKNGAWHTDPQDLVVGDQIFFQKSNGQIYHTGGCCDWDENGVYVTEANVEGGKTKIRCYPYSEFGNKIAGYGHPRFDGYEIETGDNSEPDPEPTPAPEPTPEPEPTPKPTWIKTMTVSVRTRLNVRSGPSTSYPIIGQLPDGYEVFIFEERDGWARIDETKEQWVSTDYLK